MVRRTAYGAALGVVVLVLLGPGALALTTTAPLAEPVGLGGTPVEGGPAQAPTDLTAGLWAGTLSGPGADPANTQWFRYTRTMADSTLLLGAVATSTDDPSDGIKVAVRTGSTECGDDVANSGSIAPTAAYGVFVAAGVDEDGDRDSPCVSSPTLDIAVSRGTVDRGTDVSFALRVVEEAPVVDDGPAPAEDPRVAVPTPDAPQPMPGGASFEDAPEVVRGTYSDKVPEGAERLWKVHLDWGQTLALRADLPAQDAADAEVLDGSSPQVVLTPFNPLRDSFDGAVADTDDTGSYGADEPSTLFEAAPPVAYLNRYDAVTATVPGDYWVSVSVSPVPPSLDRAPVSVPVELTVEVGGEAGAAPTFPGAVTGPGGSPAPTGYDAATPYLVDEGVFSADVSGTPRIPGAAGATADDAVRRAAGWVVGAVSLVALAAGVVLLRRRPGPSA